MICTCRWLSVPKNSGQTVRWTGRPAGGVAYRFGSGQPFEASAPEVVDSAAARYPSGRCQHPVRRSRRRGNCVLPRASLQSGPLPKRLFGSKGTTSTRCANHLRRSCLSLPSPSPPVATRLRVDSRDVLSFPIEFRHRRVKRRLLLTLGNAVRTRLPQCGPPSSPGGDCSPRRGETTLLTTRTLSSRGRQRRRGSSGHQL